MGYITLLLLHSATESEECGTPIIVWHGESLHVGMTSRDHDVGNDKDDNDDDEVKRMFLREKK